MQNNIEIPFRMYTSEVLALARWKSVATLRRKQVYNGFPRPVDRGTENIFDGRAVYQALGIIPKQESAPDIDPIMNALEKMQ